MNYSHLRADVVGSPHHVHHYHPLDNRPSTSGSDERMTHRDHVHHHHHCLPASAVAATESEQPMQVCEDVEMKDLAIPHGCSEDCSACRELSHVVDMSLRCKPPPVPPVVLVGRLPDATVVNACPVDSSFHKAQERPPFGCRGRGQRPSQSCVGPICFRRRKTPTSENVNDAGASDDPPTKIHCKNVQYPCDAFLVMNDLRKSSGHTLCDVKLQAGRHIFPAHRIVLAAASSYFRAMFTMGMKEASEDIVRMEKICPRILGKLIDFCYTSEITIGEKFVCKILPAAVMLQMQHVIDCCCHFLESQLDPCNALGIADFANQHGCTSLTKTAREFIDKHFADVSESEEFLQQSVCQLINLIKRDELVVKSESEVYNAVMLWIKYDEKNRRPHLEDIVYVVRCYFLSPDFLEQQLKSCEVLKSHPNCRQYLEKIMCDLTSHKKCQMRRRRNPDLPTVIYVVGGYIRYSLSRLECFDPKATSWRTLTDMPTCRSGVCAAFVHGLLYVAGGRCTQPEGNSDSSSMDAYDPFSDSWRSCSAMSVARSRAAAVALDNQFYVVGGSMQTTFHRSGERYNPNDETWSPIADMSRARLGLGVASLNRLLYAVGGFDGVERLQCVECYDPDTNSWRYVAPMSTVRSGAGVVALDGLLYAVGGYDGRNQLASVERYDSEADRWSPVAGMHTARSALSVVAVDGRIYAIGGYDGQEFSTAVESYDPELDEWTVERSMPEGRSGHGAAVWWGSCCYAESASPTPR